MNISMYNVSIVALNCKIIRVGSPTQSCFDFHVARDLVPMVNQLSYVKIVLRHVLERVDLHASILWSKLVT